MPTRPLPLEQLIGAPLRSLVLGQGISAQATADFIAEVGFTADPAGGEPHARTLEFIVVHPMPDPSDPGGTIDVPTRVSVPLLSLVSIPSLDIAEATVEFEADIVGVKHPR